jgi:2-polyprenyl-3-methyl-5-hydroxy-6-metoxy-1,4-benzoquinol methylase
VHERQQVSLEEYRSDAPFDLVTARMVVEHVANPQEFIAAIFRVTKPGSLFVAFTVNWWSLTTLAAYVSPMWLHHWVKGKVWNTDQKDTFETEYKMNRRSKLRPLMQGISFTECFFEVLPDASLFWRIPFVRYAELTGYKVIHRMRLPYIDSCILAVYRRLE